MHESILFGKCKNVKIWWKIKKTSMEQGFWTRRNFSLVACYSLKFTRCSLLVVKSLVTRCKIRSLLVAKNHVLLVAKSACYSLQKLLVVKNHSLLFAKYARYSLQKLLVAKNHLLLVAKVASKVTYVKSLVTRANFSWI